MNGRCIDCRFFENDPARIEAALPGLKILSSAYASVRADAGLCSLHQEFWPPWQSCRFFQPGVPGPEPVEKKLGR